MLPFQRAAVPYLYPLVMKMETNITLWPGWDTVRLIGRGSFGAVYEIQRDVFGATEKAALKVISIPQNEGEIATLYDNGYDEESITATFQSYLKNIVAEYTIMRKMNGCANIVSCDDVRYVQHDDGIGWDIYIKMELLTPLTKTLSAEIPEETVIKIAKDMCTALIACKNNGNIVHRDIKPQNIFFSSHGDYKLGDFGIARTMEKTTGGTKVGTYNYMAPEVYNNQPYSATADICSLGIVLYWLLNERRTPFLPLPPERPNADMDEKARSRRFSGEQLPPPKNGSEELKRIGLKACAFHPRSRYASAEEMLKDLNSLSGKPRSGKPLKNKKYLFFAGCISALLLVSICLGMLIARLSGSKTAPGKPEVQDPPAAGSATEQTEAAHVHAWLSATCTTPETCYTCGEISGAALGHQWQDATYDVPKTCSACGATEGVPLEEPTQPEETSGRNIPSQGRIAAGNYHSVLLSADGTVVATGSAERNDYENIGTRLDVSSWTDIVEISASSHTVGLKSDGTVVACGINQHGQCEVSHWTDIVSVRAGDNHTVGLRSDGTVVATGKNSHGQCDVSHWKNIVAIAVSENETYGLKENGTILSSGRYTYGSAWKDIASICAGPYDLYGLRKDGSVIGAGNNTKWDDNTISTWTNIVEISASSTHVVGLTANGRVVACGRSSAAEACNVQSWTDIVQVSAGMNFTIGLKSDGSVVSLGENRHGQCNLS